MRRPVIAVTCGTGFARTRPGEPQDRMFRVYTRSIANAGGVPLIVPNVQHDWLAGALSDHVDGLMLTGGADIDPALYRESPHPTTALEDPERDAAELRIVRAFVDADRPVLAICRGIQLLNVALGGTLIQDIPSQVPGALQHSQPLPRPKATHPIAVEARSRLGRILGLTAVEVNSFHHQAIKDVAPDLVVTARAPDGVIEAAELSQRRFVIAVQYHPEDMEQTAEHARALFAAFVAAARNGR